MEERRYLTGLDISRNDSPDTYCILRKNLDGKQVKETYKGSLGEGDIKEGRLEVVVKVWNNSEKWAIIQPVSGFFKDKEEGIMVGTNYL